MKNFFKVLITIITFLLILSCINLIRNLIILNEIQKTQNEFFSDLNNYYFVEESGTVGLTTTQKTYYYKDNTYFSKSTTNNNEEFVWLNKDTKEFVVSDSSIINPDYETELNSFEKSLDFQNYFNSNSITLGDLVFSNLFNVITSIDTTDWLQEKSYVIKLKDSNFEFYIGKDSSLIRALKYSDSYGIGGYIFSIEKDIVKDEDIKKPEI